MLKRLKGLGHAEPGLRFSLYLGMKSSLVLDSAAGMRQVDRVPISAFKLLGRLEAGKYEAV